jgi:hypothetical protein
MKINEKVQHLSHTHFKLCFIGCYWKLLIMKPVQVKDILSKYTEKNLKCIALHNSRLDINECWIKNRWIVYPFLYLTLPLSLLNVCKHFTGISILHLLNRFREIKIIGCEPLRIFMKFCSINTYSIMFYWLTIVVFNLWILNGISFTFKYETWNDYFISSSIPLHMKYFWIWNI